MKTKMTHAMRMELANAVRDRYAAATTKDKRRILEEFIAATGYHEKSAIRVLNSHPEPKHRQTRQRLSLYDEAARAALIVLWEASDRVCGKRLKALLPILLPALERNRHLKLEEEIRHKILSMSAATIDRLLQMPRRTMRTKEPPRVVPEPRRRIKMRTFADWNEPLPGSMEMDLVAHCGGVNRGSYVHSLVLTDIASGWTEAAPIVVREGSPRPGAPHGVADRLSPIGGIPQHQRHAALRGAVRPVSRSIYPQAVQNTRSTGQSLAPSGSRPRCCRWAKDLSSAQRQTARPTSRHL
ncbi:hypothetical protein [Mesorhizobium sp. L-2-11]|uniref:hypothetical protein n=1 Tax=Mesorhizobium sp. L-2-11 TaxID=2744521 RepID=UPI0018ECEB2D|nr:hypothetical protein [Mesorhizobium sp. L-2-11]BCH20133.1 hypothetical protein MesoLjLa_69840 [Mesorhizobium sp. L-2-11]